MNIINFRGGAKLGDFIHSLYVVKNICEQKGSKANLYMDEGGDIWTYGVMKAWAELCPVVLRQSYINMLSCNMEEIQMPKDCINLNGWRKEVATTHAETGRYNKCWSELLSDHYGFEIPKEYKWIEVDWVDEKTKNKTVIHRSLHHHCKGIEFWGDITDKEDVLFVTTDIREWEQFSYKQNARPYLVNTVSEWITAINSCEYFIGNQSAGFAIASALDVPRLVELDFDPAPFYIGEKKYSNKINFVL